MNSYRLFALLAAIALSMVAGRSVAGESYDNCKGFITTVPATISTQGVWCLNKDLATSIASGAAINIAVPNVTLDCNDWKLGGLGAGITTQAIGINGSTSNITIRNCNVRGFKIGLNLANGANHLVEHNRFDSNTWLGMAVEGDGTVIRDNRVVDTGGNTEIREVMAVAIYTEGDVEVLANLVSGVVVAPGTNGSAFAINLGGNVSGSVIENNVKNVMADGTGLAHAISFFNLTGMQTGRVSVDSNNLIGLGEPNSRAVYCPPNANAVMLLGNVAAGWGTAQVGCAFDDGNVVH